MPVNSLSDIAREAGVSRRTVTAVINPETSRRHVSKRAAEKVKAILEKTGYLPSYAALRLRRSAADIAGILQTTFLSQHVHQAVNSIFYQLTETDVNIETISTRPVKSAEGLKKLISRGVRRVIWILEADSAEQIISENLHLITALAEGRRIIIYNYPFGQNPKLEKTLTASGIYLIGINRPRSYHRLGKFLIKTGYKAVLLPLLKNHVNEKKLQDDVSHLNSYKNKIAAALKKTGIAVYCGHPVNMPYRMPGEYGKDFFDALVRQVRELEHCAVCAGDDIFAARIISEMALRRILVPQDAAVIGQDNLAWCEYFKPGITSLGIPVQKMVNNTLTLLNKEHSKKRYEYTMEIIPRQSHRSIHCSLKCS